MDEGGFFEQLCHNLNDGVIVVQDERIRFVNSRLLELGGYDESELIGLPFTAPVADDDAELVRDRYEARIKGETVPETYEVGLLTKTGAVVPFEIRSSRIEYEGESAVLIAARDITDRVEEVKKFEQVLENLRDGVVILGDGEIKLVNDTVVRISGYERPELIGRPFYDLVGESERERVRSIHEGRSQGATGPDMYETVHRTRSGVEIPVEVTVGPIAHEGRDAVVVVIRDIRERRRREAALEETRMRLQTVMDTVEAVILLKDTDGTYQLINQFAREGIGLGPEESIDGVTDEDVFPPAIAAQLREHDERVIETRTSQDLEIEIPTRLGPRILHVRSTPVIDGAGEILGVCGVGTDITEMRDREASLDAVRRKLEEAQHIANLGSWEWTIEEETQDWSDEVFRIFGLEPGAIDPTYAAFVEFVHPADQESVEAALGTVPDDETIEIEYRVVRTDGQVRTVRVRGSVRAENDERARILGTIQDITTERRLREILETIRRLDQELLQAQSESELFDSVRDILIGREQYGCSAIGLLDEDGSLTHIYDAGILGDAGADCDRDWQDIYTESYIEAALASGMYSIDDVTGPPHDHHPESVDSHGAIVLPIEYRGRTYGIMTLHLAHTRLPDEERRLLEELGSDIAISLHGVRTEERLRRETDQLRVLNRIVRHDIRNDMNVALGWSQELESHVDPEGEAILDRIRSTHRHVVDLTEVVHDFVEGLGPEGTAVVEATDLGRYLEQELEKRRSIYPDAVFAVEGTIPDVDVRANNLLSAVFRNLLNNAVMHTDKDGPVVDVGIEVRADTVTVRIADNGPGVPDAQKDAIFGRGESGLDDPASGIGLYLVDTLVRSYGGDVSVEDNDPEGSVFVVTLPRATESP